MLLSTFSSLLAAATLGGAVAGTPPAPLMADSLPFDTAQVVVTQNDFTQLGTFLSATSGEWAKPQLQALMKNHAVSYPLELGKITLPAGLPPNLKTGAKMAIPNYALIADSVPDVAQGLAKAKLTGARYMQLSRTLNNAYLTDQLDRLSNNGTGKYTETTTVIGKNVAFIRAHNAEFQKLVQQLLDVATLQTGGGGGMGGGNDDLNP